MNFAEKWHNQSRQIKNLIVMFLADAVLLLGSILSIPGLKAIWDALTGFLPDIYEPIFHELVAAIRGLGPGAVVASGSALSYVTMFLTLLTIHLVIAYAVGYLFQKLKATLGWSIANYTVLLVVLFILHLTLILKNYWFLL